MFFVEAAEYYANASATHTSNGVIVHLATTDSTGTYVGNITTARTDTDTGATDPGIRINGDYSGTMTISTTAYQPISIGGDLTSSSSIAIGTSQSSAAPITIGKGLLGSISIGSGGLGGQIAVNSTNGSNPWSGTVTVGSYTLSSAQS